jgi:hypothetical protein
MDNPIKFFIISVVGGLMISIVYIAYVYFSCGMFGCQCEKFYKEGSTQWSVCIKNLSKDLPHNHGIKE